MCGRYSLTTPPQALAKIFGVKGALPNLAPRYNIAPTQSAPVVRLGGAGRELVQMRWGLVPSWSQGPDERFSMINARAETVAEKPAFRDAYRARHCLVPADGFYEWRAGPGGKDPFHIGSLGGGPLAFAGLWEHWQGPGNDAVHSFTIITTDANDLVRPIHDRMPVIIDGQDYETWLTGTPDEAAALLRPYPAEAMEARAVSRHVNDPRHDDASCLAAVT